MGLAAVAVWDKYPKVTDGSVTCKYCGGKYPELAVVHFAQDPPSLAHLVYCKSCLRNLNYPTWGPCTCKELEGVRR